MNTYINAPEGATHTYDLVGGYIGFYRLSGGKGDSWWDSGTILVKTGIF